MASNELHDEDVGCSEVPASEELPVVDLYFEDEGSCEVSWPTKSAKVRMRGDMKYL